MIKLVSPDVLREARDAKLAAAQEKLARKAAAAAASASQFGNIIRGYDSYLKAPSASAQDRKRFRPGDPPSDKERMFSASSATFHRVSLPVSRSFLTLLTQTLPPRSRSN